MKNILLYLALILTLLTLFACGGGGSIPTTTTTTTPPAAKTTATLTIDLTGTLPASTAIAGADFTLTLPANVTPATTGGIVATSVVTNSGTFSGSTLVPQVTNTAAVSPTPGTLRVILSSSAAGGVTQVGTVATITLQLANGAVPTTGSFSVSAVSVTDAVLYNQVGGMGASVASVTLQ